MYLDALSSSQNVIDALPPINVHSKGCILDGIGEKEPDCIILQLGAEKVYFVAEEVLDVPTLGKRIIQTP